MNDLRCAINEATDESLKAARSLYAPCQRRYQAWLKKYQEIVGNYALTLLQSPAVPEYVGEFHMVHAAIQDAADLVTEHDAIMPRVHDILTKGGWSLAEQGRADVAYFDEPIFVELAKFANKNPSHRNDLKYIAKYFGVSL